MTGGDGTSPPSARRADTVRLAVPEKCCGLTLSRLAAIAVPGPASLRPANGAAAEKACRLHLPQAAQSRNSLHFSTAAENTGSLHLPQAARACVFPVRGEGISPSHGCAMTAPIRQGGQGTPGEQSLERRSRALYVARFSRVGMLPGRRDARRYEARIGVLAELGDGGGKGWKEIGKRKKRKSFALWQKTCASHKMVSKVPGRLAVHGFTQNGFQNTGPLSGSRLPRSGGRRLCRLHRAYRPRRRPGPGGRRRPLPDAGSRRRSPR